MMKLILIKTLGKVSIRPKKGFVSIRLSKTFIEEMWKAFPNLMHQ